jgi:hypothetical protein
MTRLDLEANATRVLSWGSLLTTIAVSSWSSTEPVNYIKMIILSITGFALLFSLLIPTHRNLISRSKSVLFPIILFITFATTASFLSADPLSENFFGIFGRSTGLLTYVSLCLVFLAATQIVQYPNFRKILTFFFCALLLNVAYCLLVILGYDFLPWNNIYGAPLGTFGNPNFIGSFLGFGFSATFALILNQRFGSREQILLAFILILIFFEILQTKAVQGVVVSGIGTAFVFWIFLRSKFQKSLVEIVYLSVITSIAFIAVLGALQIGPLSAVIYKASLSLRGIYWNAGINTGLENFWFGAGMDSYGTWFRRSRDIAKLGPDTMTNSAHNVFIDIFSSGGVLLLVVYLFLTFFVAHRIFRHISKSREFDPIFAIISSVWICYQAQSIISINQIGIAIWGWIFGGLIIGFTNQSRKVVVENKDVKRLSQRKKRLSSIEIGGATIILTLLGSVFGGLVASPPYLADANWRNAMQSKDTAMIENALRRWPTEPVRNSSGIILLLQNQLNESAYKVAKQSTVDFPNDYYAWYNLGIFPNISELERAEIDRQLKRLDPMNMKRPW